MRVRVFNAEDKPERDMILKLVQEDDEVTLCTCDDDGEAISPILCMLATGKIYAYGDIDSNDTVNSGLVLDNSGRVKIVR